MLDHPFFGPHVHIGLLFNSHCLHRQLGLESGVSNPLNLSQITIIFTVAIFLGCNNLNMLNVEIFICRENMSEFIYNAIKFFALIISAAIN